MKPEFDRAGQHLFQLCEDDVCLLHDSPVPVLSAFREAGEQIPGPPWPWVLKQRSHLEECTDGLWLPIITPAAHELRDCALVLRRILELAREVAVSVAVMPSTSSHGVRLTAQ